MDPDGGLWGNGTVGEGMVCTSNNGDMLLNRCLREFPPGLFHLLGNTLQPLINPRGLAVVAFLAIMALPIAADRARAISLSPAAYCSLKLTALHFLYRCSYALVLDVVLYTVFRQRRPCSCSFMGGPSEQVGSVYGMPSGDSMMGALFGAWIWDTRENKLLSRVGGVAIMLLVMAERISWGMHSLGQASAGAGMGIVLYYTSSRLPQMLVVFETALIIPIGLALILADPARAEWAVPSVKSPGATGNLLAWFVWGVAMQLTACVLITRHHLAMGILTRMRRSVHRVLDHLENDMRKHTAAYDPAASLHQALMSGTPSVNSAYSETEVRHFSEQVSGSPQSALVDARFTLCTGLCMLLLMLFSSVIQHYSAISSLGLCGMSNPARPAWCD